VSFSTPFPIQTVYFGVRLLYLEYSLVLMYNDKTKYRFKGNLRRFVVCFKNVYDSFKTISHNCLFYSVIILLYCGLLCSRVTVCRLVATLFLATNA